jgi:hypothetical protein
MDLSLYKIIILPPYDWWCHYPLSTKTKSGVNGRMAIVHEQQIIQNTSVSDDNDFINEKYKIKNNTMIMKKMCDM